MIKIYGDNILKNSKLIDSVLEKGHNFYESLHFDFEKKFIFALNKSKVLRLKFDYESDSNLNDIPNNFYVNANKLLHILEKYPILNIEFENKPTNLFVTEDEIKYSKYISIINSPNETIKIGIEIDDGDIKTFNDSFNLENMDNKSFSINDKLLKNFKTALNYSHKDIDNSLNGIFIKNNSIIASDKHYFYFEKELSELDIDVPDMELTPDLIKVINNLQFNNIKIYKSNNSVVVTDEKSNVSIIISKNIDLSLDVDTKNEEFVKTYNHETYFSLSRNLFLDTLSFLEYFALECPQSRLNITLLENKLLLKVIDNTYIEKYVDCNYISKELIGYNFWVNYECLKKIILDLNLSDDIFFQIEKCDSPDDSPIINVKNDESGSYHIIFTKLGIESIK